MIEYYMLPKLMGFSESAWSRERAWETIENEQERERLINKVERVCKYFRPKRIGEIELPERRIQLPGFHLRERRLKMDYCLRIPRFPD